MCDEQEETLDLSWLNDIERFTNIEQLYGKTIMNEINAKILYINLENTLIHIDSEICKLEYKNEKSIYSMENILLLVQSKKKRENNNYRLSEILLYNIVLEPENLQTYSKTTQNLDNKSTYLKNISTIDEIIVEPSIIIFHKINTIYFILKEMNEQSNTKPKLKIEGIIEKKTKKAIFNKIVKLTRKRR